MAYREHGGQPYHFTVMSYDERGRPEALLRYTENLGFEAIHYEYNSMNKLIRITAADPLRRHTTWYGYDNNGRVDSVWTAVDTVGSGTLLHGKPNDWGLENYVQQRPVDASITYTYTPTGKVDTMYYPQINVATWYHYTPRKWLDTLVATNGPVDLFRQELSYNNVGHITKQFSRQHGAPPNMQLYAYDAIGQLKTWSLNPLDIFNGTVQVYGYDDVGNRTSTADFQGDPSTSQGSQVYSIGPDISNPTAGPNQLLKVQSYNATPTATDYTTFAYDPDGSMTVRTQYDPLGTPLFEDRYSYSSWRGLTTGFEREDLLVQPPAPPIVWTWEYRYNAMGEREQKREMQSPSGANSLPGHSWSYYLLNGTKEQLSVWRGAETGSAGTCTWALDQVAYLYPAEYLVYAVEYPGIREDIPRLKLTPDGDVEYRITDHLASVRQTLDDNGQTVNQVDYKPFGAVLSSQGVERQGFNSREHDGEDGLSNNGVRKLDEGLGRFVAVDPLWEKFPEWSPYNYGFNSPMRVTDPSGRQGQYIQFEGTASEISFLSTAFHDMRRTPTGMSTLSTFESLASGSVTAVTADLSMSTDYSGLRGAQAGLQITVELQGSPLAPGLVTRLNDQGMTESIPTYMENQYITDAEAIPTVGVVSAIIAIDPVAANASAERRGSVNQVAAVQASAAGSMAHELQHLIEALSDLANFIARGMRDINKPHHLRENEEFSRARGEDVRDESYLNLNNGNPE